MNEDWQTWAAAGIVAITAAIFLFRLTRKKRKPGCGSACGCAAPVPQNHPDRRP